METNQNLDSVLSKLRKLKSMYEGAKKINSEGEANAAAAAIQRILTQYNLSMEEIGSDEQKKSDVIVEEQASGFTYKNIGGEWEFRLVYVLCKWNFCKCFQYGKTYKTLLMIGKKENIETVKWLREFLSERFVKFSGNRFNEHKKTAEYAIKPISKDKFQRGYLMGCVAGLDDKLKEESEIENKNLGVKMTALITRNDSAINEYLSSKYSTHYIRRKVNHDNSYAVGYRDGKETQLYKQVNSEAKKQASNIKMLK